MVFNPKGAQAIWAWGIEAALNLLVDWLESNQPKPKLKGLTQLYGGDLIKYKIPKRKISQVVYELKRNGYISTDQNGSVMLTKKAKIRLIERFLPPKADKKRRLVSFDIPESLKTQRNLFRRTIKRMGFAQIQKSLWVCDKNLGDLVENAADEYGVSDYVAYFVVESSNIESHINRVLSTRLNNS